MTSAKMNKELKHRQQAIQEVRESMDHLVGVQAQLFLQSAFGQLQTLLFDNVRRTFAVEGLYIQALEKDQGALIEQCRDDLRMCALRDQTLSDLVDTLLGHHENFRKDQEYTQLFALARARGEVAQA